MHHNALLLLVSFCSVACSAAAVDDEDDDPTGLKSDLRAMATVESELVQAAAAIGIEVPPRILLVIRGHGDLLRHWLEREQSAGACVTARELRTITRATEDVVSELYHVVRVMGEMVGPERLSDVRTPDDPDAYAMRRRHLAAVLQEVVGGLDDDTAQRLYQQIDGLADIRVIAGADDPQTRWNLVPADHPVRQELRVFQEAYQERLAREEVDYGERLVMRDLLALHRELVSSLQTRAEFVEEFSHRLGAEAVAIYDLALARLTAAIRERIAHGRSRTGVGSTWAERDEELQRAVFAADGIARGVMQRLQEFHYLDLRYTSLVDQGRRAHPSLRPLVEARCAAIGTQRDQVFAAVLARLRGLTSADVLHAKAMMDLLLLDITAAFHEVLERDFDRPREEKMRAHLDDPLIAGHLARFSTAQARREEERRRLTDLQCSLIQAQLRLDEAKEDVQRLESESELAEDALERTRENLRSIIQRVDDQIRDPQPVPDANKDF